MSLNPFVWAFLGVFLPALLWLWFWLKEDAKRPEPKRLIFAAFVAGILAVPAALFFEKAFQGLLQHGIFLVILWAATEELLKYAGAYFVAFRKWCVDKTTCVDEPIDPAIYLITAALGFSALENTLFLLAPVGQGNIAVSLITGNLRFVGAMVLHVVASGSLVLAMGLSFYKSRFAKRLFFAFGLCTAIALHTLFNVSIILTEGNNIFIVFGALWIAVLAALAVFEKVKRMKIR